MRRSKSSNRGRRRVMDYLLGNLKRCLMRTFAFSAVISIIDPQGEDSLLINRCRRLQKLCYQTLLELQKKEKKPTFAEKTDGSNSTSLLLKLTPQRAIGLAELILNNGLDEVTTLKKLFDKHKNFFLEKNIRPYHLRIFMRYMHFNNAVRLVKHKGLVLENQRLLEQLSQRILRAFSAEAATGGRIEDGQGQKEEDQ
jgi:hypothetical protein